MTRAAGGTRFLPPPVRYGRSAAAEEPDVEAEVRDRALEAVDEDVVGAGRLSARAEGGVAAGDYLAVLAVGWAEPAKQDHVNVVGDPREAGDVRQRRGDPPVGRCGDLIQLLEPGLGSQERRAVCLPSRRQRV